MGNDNNLYASGLGGLHVFDISEPAQPVEVGRYANRSLGKISLVDKTVGALGDFGQSDVIDVSDPTHPVHVGTIPDVDQHTQELAISDRTMYLNGAAGLSVYSMTPH